MLSLTKYADASASNGWLLELITQFGALIVQSTAEVSRGIFMTVFMRPEMFNLPFCNIKHHQWAEEEEKKRLRNTEINFEDI